MTVELDEVRSTIAARHGLNDAAAGFLIGASIEELEESAGALAGLLSAHDAERSELEAAGPQNIIAVARAEKAARKSAILAMFSGRPKQPRDEHGRYAGFDGGARGQAVPTPTSAENDHNQVVTRLASLAQTFRGQMF